MRASKPLRAWPFALLAFYAAGFGLRLSGLSGWVTPEGPALFSESAVHYRYAELFSRGEEPPALDREAQWPEGIRPRKVLTLLAEEAVGRLYRLIPADWRPSFPAWCARCEAGVSSLAVPAVYAVTWLAAGSVPGSLLAAAYAAFSPGILLRASRGFEHDSFAIPLLLLSLACLGWSWRAGPERSKFLRGLLAGALLGGGLLTWHAVRFWWLVMSGCLGAAAALSAPKLRKDASAGTAGWLLGALAAACLLGPFEGGADLAGSWPALAACAAAIVFARGPVWRRAALAAGAFCVLWRLAGPESGTDFGHTRELLLAKLLHLGRKPADPAVLTPEVRLLWVEDFRGATPGQLLFALRSLLPSGLFGLCALTVRPKRPVAEPFGKLLWILSLASLGAVFVSFRFLPVGALMLAVFAGLLGGEALSWRSRSGAALALAIWAAVGLEAGASARDARSGLAYDALLFRLGGDSHTYLVPAADALRTVRWIAANTPRESPVLASLPVSGAVLAAGRPVVLQPKFEHASARRKAAEFAAALFGPARDFHRLCERWGARYFVYQEDMLSDDGPDGWRAIAGVQEAPEGSAVRLLGGARHVDGFKRIFESGAFRVYQVL